MAQVTAGHLAGRDVLGDEEARMTAEELFWILSSRCTQTRRCSDRR